MKIALVFAVCLMFLSSCSRDNDVTEHLGEGYWILKGEQHNITTSERSPNSNYFILSGKESSSADVLQLYFQKQPIATGKFKVVPFREEKFLEANEIGIRLAVPGTGTYSSTGIADNKTWLPASDVDITINNGKYRVEIPKMTTIIITSTYLDTVFLEGVLAEK